MKTIRSAAGLCLFGMCLIASSNAGAQTAESLASELINTLKPYTDFSKRFRKVANVSVRQEGSVNILSGNVTAYGVKNSTFEARFDSTTVQRLDIRLNPSDSRRRRITHGDWSGRFARSRRLDLEDWIPTVFAGDVKKVYVDSVRVDFADGTVSSAMISILLGDSWQPISSVPLRIANASLAFRVDNPLAKERAPVGVLSGDVRIGSGSARIVGEYASAAGRDAIKLQTKVDNLRLNELLSAVAGNQGNWGAEIPPPLLNLGLDELVLTLDQGTKSVSADANSSLGQFEFSVDNTGTFLAGMSPPPGFSFASVASELSFLDELGLTNSAFVIASDDMQTDLDLFNELGYDESVRSGVTVIGGYNIRNASPEAADLFGVDALVFKGNAGRGFGRLDLEASIDTPSIALVPNSNVLSMRDAVVRLKPDPTGFAMSLGAMLDVKADRQLLTFDADIGMDFVGGAMTVSGQMAEVDGESQTLWSNPFGIANGLHLRDLGLRLGANFRSPIPLPVIGMQGMLIVGDPANPEFQGLAVLGIDPANPANSVIDMGFDRISLGQIIRATMPAAAFQDMPRDVRDVISGIALEDVRMTIVPSPSGIELFDTYYDPGFLLQGRSRIHHWSGELFVAVDYESGLEARASMDAIHAPPFFSLTGARGAPDPYINIIVKPGEEFLVAMSGQIEALGLAAESDILVFDEGFDFYLNGKVLDGMFESTVEVAGGDLQDGGTLFASAEMKTDFNDYFTENVSHAIDQATRTMQADISRAQQDVTVGQREMQRFQQELSAYQRRLEGERNQQCTAIRDGNREIAYARNQVNLAQRQINNVANEPAVVNARRELQMAQQSLQRAQNVMNNLHNDPGVVQARRRLDAATQTLNQAQAKIQNLHNDPGVIQARRNIEVAERDVNNARNAVNNWQSDPGVRRANADFERAKADVRSVDNQIAAIQRQIDDLHRKLNNSTRSTGNIFNDAVNTIGGGVNYGSQITAKESEKGILIGYRGSALGVLNLSQDAMNGSIRAAQETAKATLYATEQTLRGTQQAYDHAVNAARAVANEGIRAAQATVNVSKQAYDGAVRTAQTAANEGIRVAQYGVQGSEATFNGATRVAQDAANGAMYAAQGTLRGAEEAANVTYQACAAVPIEEVLLAPLRLEIEASNALMEGGKLFLEGVKQTATGTMVAADWIVNNANPLGVLKINSAGFEGCLSAFDSGNVAINFDGEFAGQPVSGSLSTDLVNPAAAVNYLAEYLLENKRGPNSTLGGGQCRKPSFAGRAREAASRGISEVRLVPATPRNLTGGAPKLETVSQQSPQVQDAPVPQ